MNDILPERSASWRTLEEAATAVFDSYGYRRIRLPLLERTELFKRAVGEVTDIVEKEMYTFEDRGGDSVSLRPEGTAGCVRACIEHGLLHNQVQRLWYDGPMFRYERPQKGRYRQFHQFGVEAYGLEGPGVDVEQVAMCARLWRRLGLTGIHLEVNSLGTAAERAAYRERLVEYLRAHESVLDQDSRRRLTANPLRILDSKNPAMAELLAAAPSVLDALGAESRAHFDAFCAALDELGIASRVNPRLVRGLDYYTRTVFEWLTDELGAQNAVCSGGRYDGLVDQLGGSDTPAVGFALGVERLIALMEAQSVPLADTAPHVYLVHQGEAAAAAAARLAEALRDALPRLRLLVHAGGGGFKSQFKRADKSGAVVALVLGEDEAAAGEAQIKPLRAAQDQETVAFAALPRRLAAYLALPAPDDANTDNSDG
jgi:histidyl-tRNA synthetase